MRAPRANAVFFVTFCGRSELARRLLLQRYSSIDLEKAAIARLKTECGTALPPLRFCSILRVFHCIFVTL